MPLPVWFGNRAEANSLFISFSYTWGIWIKNLPLRAPKPPVKRSHRISLSQMGIQPMPKASMNNRWLKAGQGMSECIPAHLQGLIPFSGEANDEEMSPTHSASSLPSWILVKPLKPQRASSIPPPRGLPYMKTTTFNATIFLKNTCSSCWLLSVILQLDILRVVEGSHVYGLY